MKREPLPRAPSALDIYLSEIARFPLLTVEEEQRLARAYRSKPGARAAHPLVTANLRFVVKIAFEYRSYGLPMVDLVQEGNIGLMMAVQRFDPDKGVRLISYAVWWIRHHILNHILRSFSLVRIGTTEAQRKLFFSLARTKRDLDRTSAEQGRDSDEEDVSKIAKKLNVKPREVEEMAQRMLGRDLSLDAPTGDEGGGSAHSDLLRADGLSQDQELSASQEQSRMQDRSIEALALLDKRERYVIQQRVMSDDTPTLQALGDHFGISGERARQIEVRAKKKLRRDLQLLATDLALPIKRDASSARSRRPRRSA